MRRIYIVDTTLRDGEQKAGIALDVNKKIEIAKKLDSLGIYQIEAGIPAMKSNEKKSIKKIVELGLKSRISAWNRMNIKDIKHSIECNVEIIHISVPSSDLQIRAKLNKDRLWVLNHLKKCVCYAKEKGFEVTVGLEDASRADFVFMLQIMETAWVEGASRIRYADTVGILYRERIFQEVSLMQKKIPIDMEIHAHNDLGMAVANSLYAAKAGAEYVNCTIGGLGERAGNCNYMKFIMAAQKYLGAFDDADLMIIRETENEIINMMAGKS